MASPPSIIFIEFNGKKNNAYILANFVKNVDFDVSNSYDA
jgi:hypothetical protein